MTTLREVRQAAGLTQEQLAARAGVTTSTIHVLERGGAVPKPATLAGLRSVLGPAVDGIDWTVTTRRAYPWHERRKAERATRRGEG